MYQTFLKVKASLRRLLMVLDPDFKKKHLAKVIGKAPAGGVLFHGPPGNGKTRLVMATATEYGLPVISLSTADVYSPYVGDSEAEIRKAFQLARQASPCILFLDELDSIVTNRDGGDGGGSTSATVESRVLATLLTEMDGIGRGLLSVHVSTLFLKSYSYYIISVYDTYTTT